MVLWHKHEYAIMYEDVIWLDILSIFDTKALLENENFLLLILRRCCKKYWLMKLGFSTFAQREWGTLCQSSIHIRYPNNPTSLWCLTQQLFSSINP